MPICEPIQLFLYLIPGSAQDSFSRHSTAATQYNNHYDKKTIIYKDFRRNAIPLLCKSHDLAGIHCIECLLLIFIIALLTIYHNCKIRR